jgi:hypothetical protein
MHKTENICKKSNEMEIQESKFECNDCDVRESCKECDENIVCCNCDFREHCINIISSAHGEESSIEKLRIKHGKEIEKLQSECEHRETNRMAQYWAPGHSSGYDVEVCRDCGKTVKEYRDSHFENGVSSTSFGEYTVN